MELYIDTIYQRSSTPTNPPIWYFQRSLMIDIFKTSHIMIPKDIRISGLTLSLVILEPLVSLMHPSHISIQRNQLTLHQVHYSHQTII